MKILLVADLHYALQQFDWLLTSSHGYDLVVVAGDLLDTNAFVDAGTQIVVVLKYLQRLRAITNVVICSGNHDLDEIGADGEKRAGWMKAAGRLAVPGDGDSLMVGDLLVTICPWWDGPLGRQAIADQLERTSRSVNGPWLWVYHAPPANSPVSWSGHRHFGDEALLDWVAHYQPDFVVCGHVHEAPFAKNGSWVDQLGRTWLFNAGRQIGAVPTTISMDTSEQEAAWFSLEGAETVRLDQPLTRPIEPLTTMPRWMTNNRVRA